MPIDINILRKNPNLVKDSQRKRFADESLVDKILELDEQWRKSSYKKDTLKMEFGKINKEVADRKKKSKGQDKCEDLIEKSKLHQPKIVAQEEESNKIEAQKNKLLNLIGNILGDKVPVFESEDNNEEIKKWGNIPDL